MLRVIKIEGEATRFYVESQTLQCVNAQCSKLFNRRRRPDLWIGQACPKCDVGTLDVRFHVVDLSCFNLNGECSCEYFAFSLGPKVSRLQPVDQGAGAHRCSHIEAARGFALDVSLRAHEAVNGASRSPRSGERVLPSNEKAEP